MLNYFNKNFLLTTRLRAILILGFTSGLPLVLVSSTLQAWLTAENINLLTIATLSLLSLPYSLKFLWAPLMDHYSFLKLGQRKSWILLTQLIIVGGLIFLSLLTPSHSLTAISLLILIIAFFSASQDIAINGYQTNSLSSEERGLGVSYYVLTYRIALLIGGGLALILADYLGFNVTYGFMALLMAIFSIATYFYVPEIPITINPEQKFYSTILNAYRFLLQKQNMIFIFIFIGLYKFGDALALQLMTPFLMKGLGFSLTEIGLVYKTLSFFGVILGGILGGILLSRMSLFSGLLWFGLAQAISNLLFIVLAYVGKNFIFMSLTVFIENFCSGLSTAALFAFLMSLCDKDYAATQFAILSAIASIGRIYLGPLAGYLIMNFGWQNFFTIAFILSFPGVLMLFVLKDRVYHYATTAI